MANEKLIRLLKKDDVYTSFRRIVAGSRSSEYDTLVKELKRMMKARLSRSLSNKWRPSKIINALGQDQSFRSRSAEIMMELVELDALLAKNYSVAYDHIITNYSVYLARYKTKGERENAVRSILSEAKDVMAMLKMIDKMASIMIADIDKAAWGCSHALERWKMVNQAERTV